MKSATVELGAYARPRAAHYWTPEQIRQILAVMPAGKPWLLALLTGRCESWLAHGVRPLRRGNPVSHKPIPTTAHQTGGESMNANPGRLRL